VTLTIKEKTRLRRRTMAAIRARILAIDSLRTLGLSKILTLFRDAKSTEIYEGTTEIEKIIMAKNLLP